MPFTCTRILARSGASWRSRWASSHQLTALLCLANWSAGEAQDVNVHELQSPGFGERVKREPRREGAPSVIVRLYAGAQVHQLVHGERGERRGLEHAPGRAAGVTQREDGRIQPRRADADMKLAPSSATSRRSRPAARRGRRSWARRRIEAASPARPAENSMPLSPTAAVTIAASSSAF